MRHEGAELLRLIDSSPIPLGKVCDWADWNGRIRGMKMHVVYDPKADRPCSVEVTPATVNDVEVGRKTAIEAGATYVFDKGYCHYGWWAQIDAAKAIFVTRAKSNMRLRATKRRKPRKIVGDGFRIIDDAEVRLVSKGDSKLAIPLRRIRVRREDGSTIKLITNDMKRQAVEIASSTRSAGRSSCCSAGSSSTSIIRKFLGNNENAIHLQILAAMIAYLLLRIAARLHRVKIPLLRLAELVGQWLFTRKNFHQIDRPPPVNPSKPTPKGPTNQMVFCLCSNFPRTALREAGEGTECVFNQSSVTTTAASASQPSQTCISFFGSSFMRQAGQRTASCPRLAVATVKWKSLPK